MQCPRCQHENPAGVKFCGECGAHLESLCPACRAANPPATKFCHQCGAPLIAAASAAKSPSPDSYTPKHLAEKILTSKSALEGERKQVTVLFVDVSGFTGLSERLDPEDVHGLMNRAFELMLAEVHGYEGTVNQFLGDGIMALFGAPIAHEDHAQRAVHAALGIRRVLQHYQESLRRERGIAFQARQGLNTGLVVVGSIGNDLRMDYTAVGDTTNVAARLQQAADPGRVVIAESTHRLVSGYFYLRPLGELVLKGKAEAVRAWEVIGARQARTRLDIEAERGLTPFVGRDRELRLLAEGFEAAKASRGQTVFIVGEPGIGKSRLLLEFRRQIGDQATWVEGRSMSFGRSIAFHPLIDLLKRTFNVEETDSEAAIIEKIERSVLLLGEDLRGAIPHLRYLLAVDPGDPAVATMDPQLRRAELLDAIQRLLMRAAEVHPQIVVFEDAHWMDQATEEYVVLMADSVAASRVLMILTYRPGYTPPLGERTYHTRLALSTLSAADSVRLAGAMLAAQSLPSELETLIARKAEGNPFFVEEVVKSLLEVGVIVREGDRLRLARRLDEVVVPDTIQDVIMARIDRLAEAPKNTLQLASVIGREFTRRLLERISKIRERTGEFLRELQAIELIYEKSLFPELAYMFKHALTHDVAYNSLLVQRRRELHRLIGLAIEELYTERLAEHYEVLGHHFSQSGEWGSALDYLLKGADKAARAFANREAVALYDQALAVIAHLGAAVDPRMLMAIHQARASLFVILSDFGRAREEGERVVALARQVDDRVTEGAALAGIGLAAFFAHDFEPALERSCQAAAVADAAQAMGVAAQAALTTGWVHTVTGRLAPGRLNVDRALALSRSAGEPFNLSLALSVAGEHESWAGRCDPALRLQAEALQIAREHHLVFPLNVALFCKGLTLSTRGDYETGRALFEEGLAFSQKVGDEIFNLRFLNSLGWLHLELGSLDTALDLNRRGADGARKRGDPETAANAELNLADVFLVRGDLALAAELLEGVHRQVKDPAVSEWQKWRYSMHLFMSLAECWLARGDFDRSRAFADQCLEVATRTDSRKFIAAGWRLRGEVARLRRQWDEADAALREAVAAARAVGNPPQLWKAHAALGQLGEDARRPEVARAAFLAARHVVEAVKAGLSAPALRAKLDDLPLVRHVYAQSPGDGPN